MEHGPLTLAIDIGATGLKAGVLDADGALVVPHARVDTPKKGNAGAGAAGVADADPPLGAFDRISVGFPGVVRAGQVLTAPNLGQRRLAQLPARRRSDRSVGQAGPHAERCDGARLRRHHRRTAWNASSPWHRLRLRAVRQRTADAASGTGASSDPDDIDYDQYVGNAALKKIGRKRWNKRLGVRTGLRAKPHRLRPAAYRRRQRAAHPAGAGPECPHRAE